MFSTDAEASVGATTILLIRHGETAWNAERRLQGHGEAAGAILAGQRDAIGHDHQPAHARIS